MKYGIISDIHSNIEALDKVLDNMEKVDAIICLGDIVGYGANPNECISRVKEIKSRCIAGNHDLAAVKKLDVNFFNDEARAAIQWTSKKLTRENICYLESLKEKLYLQNNVYAIHGSPGNNKWDYINNRFIAAMIFEKYIFDIIFIGHSHIAGCFVLEKTKKRVDYIDLTLGGHVLFLENRRYIVNCGSVGQPRDGNSKASYGIYNDKKKEIIVKRINYPIFLAQNKILNAGLPKVFADRLKIGR